jgi:hypothetical protein
VATNIIGALHLQILAVRCTLGIILHEPTNINGALRLVSSFKGAEHQNHYSN